MAHLPHKNPSSTYYYHATAAERAQRKLTFDQRAYQSLNPSGTDFHPQGTLYLNPDFRDAVEWASRKLQVSPLAVVFVFECPSSVHNLGNTCDLSTDVELWNQVVRICRGQNDQAPDFEGFDGPFVVNRHAIQGQRFRLWPNGHAQEELPRGPASPPSSPSKWATLPASRRYNPSKHQPDGRLSARVSHYQKKRTLISHVSCVSV